jgi:hypothetical protein
MLLRSNRTAQWGFVFLVAFAWTGCAPAPEKKSYADLYIEHPPVPPKLRKDGIYSCRQIAVVGSAGGIVWALPTPSTVQRTAEFLKFNDDGSVGCVCAFEPVSMEEVRRRFAIRPGDENGPLVGMYVDNVEGLFFILKGPAPTGMKLSEMYEPKVGENRLIIKQPSVLGKAGPHEYLFEPNH